MDYTKLYKLLKKNSLFKEIAPAREANTRKILRPEFAQDIVLKIANDHPLAIRANILEYEVYLTILKQHYKLAKYFAKCKDISDDGGILIQEYLYPIDHKWNLPEYNKNVNHGWYTVTSCILTELGIYRLSTSDPRFKMTEIEQLSIPDDYLLPKVFLELSDTHCNNFGIRATLTETNLDLDLVYLDYPELEFLNLLNTKEYKNKFITFKEFKEKNKFINN